MKKTLFLTAIALAALTVSASERFCIAKDGKAAQVIIDNIRWLEVNFPNTTAGKHTLKLILIDPEIVIETIVVNPDNNRYSYFGK